jgi:hypothetical protein
MNSMSGETLMKRTPISLASTLILSGLTVASACGLAGCKAKNPLPIGEETPIGQGAVVMPNPATTQPVDNNQDAKPVTDVIAVVLTADKSTYRRGDIVTFTITARNTTNTAQRLTFASGKRFDVVATPEGENKEAVWRWSSGKMFTQIFGDVNWRPGEIKTWTATWDQTNNGGNVLPRGRFNIQSELASTPRLTSAPLTITLAD